MASIVSHSSNPMATTWIGHCRPQVQSSNSTAEPETTNGGYKMRKHLSATELTRLQSLEIEGASKGRHSVTNSLFRGLIDQLKAWPKFFASKEESGAEIQQTLVTLWSNFLVAETLMASIAIQPLVTVPDSVCCWRLKIYGFIWMISAISDFMGIAITALFLGFLLGCPGKAAWYWVCEIGWMRNIPSILVLLDTCMSLAAIAYTCWVVYGFQIGIITVVVEIVAVTSFLLVAAELIKAGDEIQKLH